MNKKGQLQLEAIVCFAAFLGILAIFIGSISFDEKAINALEAKKLAEGCCIAVDNVFASGVSRLLSEKNSCTVEGNQAMAIVEGKKKLAGCLAKARLVQAGKETVLEVEHNEHYR